MSLTHRQPRPATFGDFPYKMAKFKADAINGGPFRNAPALSPIVVWADDDAKRACLKVGIPAADYDHEATPVEFSGDGKRFYLLYSEDCFSPPMFVVRADNESDAVDLLLENHPKHFKMSAADVEERERDGIPETVGYAGNGSVPYDNETLRCREVRLVSVQFS